MEYFQDEHYKTELKSPERATAPFLQQKGGQIMSLSSITSSTAHSFDAGQAYGRAQQLSQTSTSASGDLMGETETSDAVSSFSNVLGSAIRGAINTGKVAESQTAQALSGKGNMSDVVASVEEAKLTLQTVTTLRDRFVSAYQDIMRMSV